MTTKQCTQYFQIKSINDFHNRSYSSDGHRSVCKECVGKQTDLKTGCVESERKGML